LGSEEWAAGRAVEAERCYQLALEEDPHFATARGSLGLLWIQFLGRPDEGRNMLTQALEDASEVSRREYLMIRAVNRQFVDDDPDEALSDYRLISELYPDAVAPYNNSGRILESQGRYEEAVIMYERALEVDPRAITPLWNLWTMYLQRLRRPQKTEEIALQLIERAPESPWSRHALAWTYVALRRFDEAEVEMRAVLELDPDNSYASPNLAHLLFRRGAYDEAVEVYLGNWERSHRNDQIATNIHDSLCLGLALQGAGRVRDAREVLEGELEDLAARTEGDATSPVLRACLLAALGRSREALALVRVFDAGSLFDPSQLFILAEAFTLMGEPERAVVFLKRAYEVGYNDPYYVLVNPPMRGLQNRSEIEELAPPS